MKRRLALLLALTLTFATLSPAGAIAAETDQAQVIEDVSVVEEAEVAEQEETEQESAQEATTVEAAAEEAVVETVAEEEENKEEQTEEADASATEAAEAADTAATDTETAAAEEPAAVQEEEAAVTEITEEALVIEEPVVEEVAKEAEAAVVNKLKRNTSDGKLYYYGANGAKAKNYGWLKYSNGKTYYIGADGATYTGFKKIGGKTYYFWDSRCESKGTQGAMMTGWTKIKGKKFYFADGGYPALGKDYPGAMLTGWRKIGGKMYFFANSLYPSVTAGTMMTGWRTIDSRKYYMGSDGVRKTGFQEIDGKKYYFVDKQYSAYTTSKEGMMLTGSKKIGGKYYYFSPNGIMKFHQWVRYNGLLGYFHQDGTARTGWKEKVDGSGNWYYLKENGFAQTGWLKLNASSIFYLKGADAGRMVNEPTVMSDGKLYYFGTDGRRATTKGWKGYGPYYYYTYENGTCAVNKTIEGIKLDENGRTTMTKMDMKAQDYSSNTNYLIMVDKSTYTVCIYKGKKGSWLRIKGEWPCTHGGSLTPEGEKTIVGRLTKRSETYGWADFQYSSAAFTMELSSGNFMHSVLFEKGTRGNPYDHWIMDPDMYRNYSKGCIRLQLPNAEWVWDNIPKGTKVVVYRSK